MKKIKSSPDLVIAKKSTRLFFEETLEDLDTKETLVKEYEDALKCKKIKSVIDNTILRELGYEIREAMVPGMFSTFRRAMFVEEEHIVKIVDKSMVPEECLRFYQNELKVIRDLHHRNILSYVCGIETQYKVYLVSRHAQVGNLRSFLARASYLPEDLAQDFFIDLLNGVCFCHSLNIAHSNISSGNILFTSSFVLKLSDFKFAKKYKLEETPLSRTYCGEYHYAAPEVMNCRPYDPFLADVWSMGVVFYEMLKGDFPFHDLKDEEVDLCGFYLKCREFPVVRDISTSILENIFQPCDARASSADISLFPWVDLKLSTLKYDSRESKHRSTYHK